MDADSDAGDDTSSVPAASTALSPRELEVLHLVSTGMTSPEIAATLFVSPHTVKRHMANIREKLGVRSQAAAIAALRDRGV
jgi:DNA-binding CsgD family transcriptional regulator